MSIKLEDVCRHLSQLQITNNKDDIARLQPRVIKYPQRAYRKRERAKKRWRCGNQADITRTNIYTSTLINLPHLLE